MKKLTNQWLNIFWFVAAAMIIGGTTTIAYAQRPSIKPELMDWEIKMGNEMENIIPYFRAKGNVANHTNSLFEYDPIKGVVKNDFLINDDTAGSCTQVTPSVAYGPDGSYVIVWTDKRSGYYDVYGQKFNSSGQPLGSEYKVNDNNEYVYNFYPSVAIGENSNMVITWETMNLNFFKSAVFIQIYDSIGNPVGSNIKINNDSIYGRCFLPSIVMAKNENIIVTWSLMYNSLPRLTDIYYQKLNKDGSTIGANIKINPDSVFQNNEYSSIATDTTGNFIIAWRKDGVKILAQMFDSTGVELNMPINVTDDSGYYIRRNPNIASSPNGNFIISWTDYRNGHTDIYMQLFDNSGKKVGANIKVNNDSTGGSYYSKVANINSSNYVVTWALVGINIQQYDSIGNALEGNIKVSDNDFKYTNNPAIAAASNGNYLIAWHGWAEDYDADIYYQVLDSSDNFMGQNVKANDDAGTSWQAYPVIAANQNGDCIACWRDEREGYYDYYMQRFNSNGNFEGANIKTNEDTIINSQLDASLDIAQDGKYAVCWNNGKLLLKIFGSNDLPVGSVITVDSNLSNNQQTVFLSTGNVAVVWESYGDRDRILFSLYDSTGNLIKEKIQVNNDTNTCWLPALSTSTGGGFSIVWQDYKNSNFEIFGQRYDSLGDTIGGNFKVAAGGEQYFPNVAAAENGKFVVVWQTGVTGLYVCAQRFDSLGTPVDTSLIVYKNTSYDANLYPVVAFSPDGSKFIVGWTGYNNTGEYSDFMGQVYDGVTGDKIGASVIINEDTSFTWQQQTTRGGSNIACNNDNIFFVWQDNRRNLGWDIYCKITDWGITGVQSGHDFVTSNISYALMQNAPNPSTGGTEIRYQLAKQGRVTLKIYNTLGQVVKTLVNETKPAGAHVIKWDGRNDDNQKTSAGIYIYRLESGEFSANKKMVIIR